jgi:hypothetical protein
LADCKGQNSKLLKQTDSSSSKEDQCFGQITRQLDESEFGVLIFQSEPMLQYNYSTEYFYRSAYKTLHNAYTIIDSLTYFTSIF